MSHRKTLAAAAALLLALAATERARAGNVVITGHDSDVHGSTQNPDGPPDPQALAQVRAIAAFARKAAPSPGLPVLVFDHGTKLAGVLTSLGIPIAVVDPNQGVPAATLFDVTRFSAIAVPSSTCGPPSLCDNDAVSSANLAAAAPSFKNFVIAHGGLFAFAGAGDPNYYHFLPYNVTATPFLDNTGFMQTPAGAQLGIPPVTSDYAHSYFGQPGNGSDPAWIVAETYTPISSTQFTAPITMAIEDLQPVCPASVGTLGTPYSQTVVPVGASGSVTVALSTGTLPYGITLNSGGTLSGTPIQAGPFTFGLSFTDAFGTVSKSCGIAINPQVNVNGSCPAGVIGAGAPFSFTFTATGGSGSYTWLPVSSSLPPGLALNPGTGVLAGTPTTAGNFPIVIQATDTNGATGAISCPLTVTSPVGIANVCPLPSGEVGVPFSLPIAAAGGTGQYTFSVSGALPAGLVFNGSTIAGTPTVSGAFPIALRAVDTLGTPGTLSCNLVINAGPSITSSCPLPNAAVGSGYSRLLSATGGSGGYGVSLAGGSLPPGLNLSGLSLSGNPTTAGPYSFTLRVTDSAGGSSTQQCGLTVLSPVQITNACPFTAGEAGVPFSLPITASGGNGQYTFSVSGALPLGLSFNGAAITGTPTAAGGSPITLSATDSLGTSGTLACNLAINPAPSLTNACPLTAGTVGIAYGQTLAATGGTGAYVFSIPSGALPAGLALNGNSISGNPTVSGTATFAIRVTDAAGGGSTQSCSVAVNAPLTITTACPLNQATPGLPFSQAVTVTGGTGPGTYQFALTGGFLTPGLSLNASTGVISGTPAVNSPASSSFTIQATDLNGATVTRSCAIATAPALTITTACPASAATIGSGYAGFFTAANGTAPFSWTVIRGSLPPGLQLNASGAISGIVGPPPGSYSFTAQVSDATGVTASQTCSIASDYPPPVFSCPASTATVGSQYLQALSASGGAPGTIVFNVSGSLPPGLILDNNSIRGIPTSTGASTFNLLLGNAPPLSCSIAVGPNPLSLSGACPLPGASLNASYSQTVIPTGGTAPYSFVAINFPTGLSINQNGLIAGIPITAGTGNVGIRVTDSAGLNLTQTCSLAVGNGPSITTGCPLNSGVAGAPYAQKISVTGGAGPYTFKALNLPAGLSIDPGTGLLGGNPSNAGSTNVTIQVTDAGGASATPLTCAIEIKQPSPQLTIAACALPDGRVGSPYSQTLSATGGTPPLVWDLASGTLPDNIGLTPDGTVGGTPSSSGAFTFNVHVTDKSSTSATQNCSLTINAPLSITSVTPPSVPAGGTSDVQIAVNGTGFTSSSATVIFNGTALATTFVSSTQLTAIVPAQLLSPGKATIQVAVGGDVAKTDFLVDLPALSALNLTVNGGAPPASIDPAVQPVLGLKLASPYPFDLTVTVTVSVKPNPVAGRVDPTVAFLRNNQPVPSSTVVIPAGSTSATLTDRLISTGTLAGNLVFSVTATAANLGAVPLPAPVSVSVDATAPILQKGVCFATTGTQVQLQLNGLTPTRELTQASVTFTPAAGSTLQTASFTIPLAAASSSYFGSDASTANGGKFFLALPFNFQGNASGIDSVSVTVSNSIGASQPQTGGRCP